MSSLFIIAGNEPHAECIAAGYSTSLAQFHNKCNEAEYNLWNLWNVDHESMRQALLNKDIAMIQRIVAGGLAESSHLEFPYIIFASPEMYYLAHKLKLYPAKGQIINLVSSVKYYIRTKLCSNSPITKIGVIGSKYSVQLFSEFSDTEKGTHLPKCKFYAPDTNLADEFTTFRLAYDQKVDPASVRNLYLRTINEFDEQGMDGVILADLETERCFKEQSYLEHLTEIAAHNRLFNYHYSHIQQKPIFVLSAMQALISQAARECSRSRVPETK